MVPTALFNNGPGLDTAVKLNGDVVDAVVPNPPNIFDVVLAGIGARLNADERVGLTLKLKALEPDVDVDPKVNPL